MNKTLVSIFFILMLIIPIFSISAVEEKSFIQKIENNNPLYGRLDHPNSKWLIGADQMQINVSGYATHQEPELEWAQAFIPTKSKLTAVALYYERFGNPHDETKITVSIRDELDGPDLTNITILAKDYRIKGNPPYTWVLFDFPDINVNPGQMYYIHEMVSHGDCFFNFYGMIFGVNNPYTRGDLWQKIILHEWTMTDEFANNSVFIGMDLNFITYYQEPKIKTHFHPIFIFLEQHPHLFPLLQRLLGI